MAASTADLLQEAARLHGLGALGEAAARYRQVLGTALHQLGRHDDAIASYDRVLTLQPNIPEAHNV